MNRYQKVMGRQLELPRLGYRRTWAKTFYGDEMELVSFPGYDAPKVCPDHKDPATGRSWCFQAFDDLGPLETAGDFKQKYPIDIYAEMPGYNQKVLTVSYIGMHRGSFGTTGWGYCNIRLFGDDAEIFKSDGMEYPHDRWTDPPVSIPVNKDISGYSKLSLRLHQHAVCRLPSSWVAIHIKQITINAIYYTTEPPPSAEVRIDVINAETGAPVSGAYVAIMSGTTVVAHGYTDGGSITFPKIDEASYTLRIRADGYEAYEGGLEVKSPMTWPPPIALTPIPPPPWPWWWQIAAVGGGVAVITVIGVIAYQEYRRREEIMYLMARR